MRIEWATICVEVRPGAAGEFTLVEPLRPFTFASPDATVRLDVAIVIIERFELLREVAAHSVRCRVLDPDLNPVSDGTKTTAAVMSARPDGYAGGSDQRGIIRVRPSILVGAFGTYTIELSIDGGEEWTLSHHILDESVNERHD